MPGKLCVKPARNNHKEICPSKKKNCYAEGLKSHFGTKYIDYKN